LSCHILHILWPRLLPFFKQDPSTKPLHSREKKNQNQVVFPVIFLFCLRIVVFVLPFFQKAILLIESRGKPRHSCRGRIARTANPSWNFDIQCGVCCCSMYWRMISMGAPPQLPAKSFGTRVPDPKVSCEFPDIFFSGSDGAKRLSGCSPRQRLPPWGVVYQEMDMVVGA